DILAAHHKSKDFEIVVPLELLRQAERTKQIFNIVLGSIAAISLLVGGIGIMNIMLASVTERTREIGIRRALGAKRRDIVLQFLIETVILSGAGGAIGVLLGLAIPFFISYFAEMRTIVTPGGPILAFSISGAVGIIFAHRSGAKAAEKVCHLGQIQKMQKGGAIVDIAIDQGGSIAHPDYREEDDAATARHKYHELLADYFYYAETNMPRESPHDASEVHGDASSPYVAMLLALAAIHGGPEAAAEEILKHEPRIFTSRDQLDGLGIFGALVQDLRNGVQLTVEAGAVKIAHPDIARDAALSSWLAGCAAG
ncbi:MAG: FtsX-like permease family protein, partial [Thermoanaerobaculia bacterium]|nr:FtsX-like permease family protein [Thermoanaerobaculia bacterium]